MSPIRALSPEAKALAAADFPPPAKKPQSAPPNVVDLVETLRRSLEESAGKGKKAMLRNLDIATKLSCLDEGGLAEMKHGESPTVRRGPYKGQELSVDHIVPRAVAPELDNVIANLELLPLRLNQSKNANIGQRQRSLARKFSEAGLLSVEGNRAVQKHR